MIEYYQWSIITPEREREMHHVCFMRWDWVIKESLILKRKKDQRRKERKGQRGTERQRKRSDKKVPKDGEVIKIQHLPREEEEMRDDMSERNGKSLIFYPSVPPSSPPSLSGQLTANLSSFHFLPAPFIVPLAAPVISPPLPSYIFNMHSSLTRSDMSDNNKLPHRGSSPPLFHPFSSITAPQSLAPFA